MPKPRYCAVVRSYYNETGDVFTGERRYRTSDRDRALNMFAAWLVMEGFDEEIRLECYLTYEHTK